MGILGYTVARPYKGKIYCYDINGKFLYDVIKMARSDLLKAIHPRLIRRDVIDYALRTDLIIDTKNKKVKFRVIGGKNFDTYALLRVVVGVYSWEGRGEISYKIIKEEKVKLGFAEEYGG